jgi:hypothetical protein
MVFTEARTNRFGSRWVRARSFSHPGVDVHQCAQIACVLGVPVDLRFGHGHRVEGDLAQQLRRYGRDRWGLTLRYVDGLVLLEPLVGEVEELVEFPVEVRGRAHAAVPVALVVVLVLLVPGVRLEGITVLVAAKGSAALDVLVVLLAGESLDVPAGGGHRDRLGACAPGRAALHPGTGDRDADGVA